MTDSKPVNRIPFEDIEQAQKWAMPVLGEGRAVVSSVKRKTAPPSPAASSPAPNARDGVRDSRERVEDVAPASLQPITAEQLQSIAEQAEREGYEQGYREGLEKGSAEGERKGRAAGEQKAYVETLAAVEAEKKRFRQIADALLAPLQNQDNALENTLLNMAVHLAKHLLNRELAEDPSALFHLIERAVASLPAGARNIRIHLHADDVELAHEAFAQTGREWTFYPDPQLSRGGCRVVSEHSLVDYSVEHRLQTLLDAVHFLGDVDESAVSTQDRVYGADDEPLVDYRPHEPDAFSHDDAHDPAV